MEKDGIELRIDNSAYYFMLESILKKKGISKNKLCKDTNTDYKVVSRLINGELVKLDIYVLARIAEYLDCDIYDIIKFKRNIYRNI